MKDKKVLLFILTLFLVTTLSGCNKSSSPKAVFDSYIGDWQKSNFSNMYSKLDMETKKTVSEKDFTDRYKTIYEATEVKNISIKPTYPEKFKENKDGEIIFPVAVTLDTFAGQVNFTYEAKLIKEKHEKKEDWFISWNEKMIFPQLEKGDKVAIKKDDMRAKRGEIKDRNGKGLAVNGTVSSIGIVPGELDKDRNLALKQISDILDITVSQIEKKLGESWVKPTLFVPIASITNSEGDKLSKLMLIKGVKKQNILSRVYPYNEAAAHLVGYIGGISTEELDKLKGQGYTKDSKIGKAGLEQIFEQRLKGEDGGIIYTTDDKGKTKKTIAQKLQKDGEEIKLTIDIDLQQALYNEFKGEAGVATSINPITGEALALVSSPAYNPNLFVNGIPQKQWDDLSNDTKKPLLNRFTATFTPGSTFKPITAGIALKSGKWTQDKTINVSGKTWQGSSSWGGYSVTRVSDPGKPVGFVDAFVYSDNIYFAQAALSVGKEDFSSEVKNFGIGEKIPFSYPLNGSILSPSGTLDKDVDVADSGYGQGKVSTNPLHLALIYGALVNKGDIVTPVLELKDKDQGVKIWHSKAFSEDNAKSILNALTQVVENPEGTAHLGKIDGVSLAGKTGTAEFKKTTDDKTGKENGWFVALNTDNPRLVVAMMIEDVKDKGGSHYVVPKVQNVMRQFLK